MPQRYLRNSTVKVSELFQKALGEMANARKAVFTSEFILLVLIDQNDSIFLKVLDELNLDTDILRRDISDALLTSLQKVPGLPPEVQRATINMSQDVQNIFETADKFRETLGDTYISTSAVLLACLDSKSPVTSKVLEDNGLTLEKCLDALRNIRGNSHVTQKDSESRQSHLDNYTTDITALARKGMLDPVVKRDKEIRSVIEILSRRKKNNPILIGEPGVGKTVIIEGLAQQIVNADVPEFLLNKKVLSLEMSDLLAGAKMQGEFEERLKAVKDEIVDATGEIILFIDEIHTVVGAGRSGGAMDASNMLKPALAKGLLQCIGATTIKEHKKYIEADKALDRRFQPVKVEEPTVEDAINILKGVKEKYEAHHQVQYSQESIIAAALLSNRYIQDRFLPDKAIDLIDEAGAAKRIEVVYTPPEMRGLETKRHSLEADKMAAFNSQDFEEMASIQMEIARIEEKLNTERQTIHNDKRENSRLVVEDDIARLISKKTGIPAARMVAAEAERLIHLEKYLSERVVGQNAAISSVANAIRRNRAGLRKDDSPIASFLFLGPTGVGKTELAKALAAEVMDDESKIIRIDMSEYMERHDVAKLIGSPPGYVGYGEGGQLTEKIKHNPYSVVLFDEFEKAHPDVYNILLQVLDEGWLTDGEGQKVSFRNSIIIGTSNIGSHLLVERKKKVGFGTDDNEEDTNRAVLAEAGKYLRPEFINRLDEIIVFNKLSREELGEILDIQVSELSKRLAQLNIVVEFTDEAKDFVLGQIDTMNFGARPVKRKLQKLVENKIAELLIEANSNVKSTIKISVKDKELQVSIGK